jgi:type I restriction enzyme S subunit
MKLVNPKNPVMASWLRDQDFRLDAPPFLSGAIEARKLLEQLPVKKEPLASLTEGHNGGIYNGPMFRRNYVIDREHGVPFLTSSGILLADLSTLPLLSKKDAMSPRLAYLQIREGMTLISCSGAIGRMAYTRPEMSGMWSSQDVLKVVPNPDRILPGYLYAFLSSRFGVPLVVGGTYGAIIQHIEPHHIANLPVPRLNKEVESRVHRLVQEAADCLTEHSALLRKATRTLLDRCGLRAIDALEWHSNRQHLGWAEVRVSPESLRALNFDPRAKAIRRSLSQCRTDPLGSLCDPRWFKGKCIFRRVDASPEFGLKLVGQREAFHIRPEGRWISRKSIEGLGLQVPPGTILIPSHGTLGERELYCRALIVTYRTAEYAFSGDFFRCIPLRDRVLAGYLFAFLRSPLAFRLLRTISIGGKQQEQHPAMMWRFPVPRLDEQSEVLISEMVENACGRFDRALEAEDEAQQILESAIEEAA